MGAVGAMGAVGGVIDGCSGWVQWWCWAGGGGNVIMSGWLREVPVFLPISLVTVGWEFLMLLFIVCDFSLTILVQCFEDDFLAALLYDYFDRILVVILMLDILFSLNTCILRRGVIIAERGAIAREYLRSVVFVVDAVSLALGVLQLVLNSRQEYKTYFNFLVFVKVVKVGQFDRNIKRYGLKSFNSLLVYEILKNIVFLALICHIVGCFAYLIDYNLMVEDYYGDPSVYWLVASYAYPNIYAESFWVRYTYSFYYSTSILSGIAYGDLVPLNPLETIYNGMILLLPLVIYSYIFNAIYDVISKKRERNKQVKKYQFLAKRYFKTLRVKKNLQVKLITYLSFIFRKTLSSAAFVSDLAPSARKHYLAHTTNAKFDFAVFTQLLSLAPLTPAPAFRARLSAIIVEEAFPERYRLVAAPARIKLYFINQGICKRVTLTPAKYSDDITRRQYACFYPFLTGLIPTKLRYESASFVVCQTVSRAHFLELLRERQFSELREAFFLMMEEKLLYANETVLGENCFFCHDHAHFLDTCKHLRPKLRRSPLTPSNYRAPHRRRPTASCRLFLKFTGDGERRVKKAEMSVQCTVVGPKKRGEFEVVTHNRIYYPEFNIDA